MTSPSADEKRLAENVVGMNDRFIEATRKRLASYRAAHPGNEDTAEEILLRLLDAAQARLAEMQRQRNERGLERDTAESRAEAAEEQLLQAERERNEARDQVELLVGNKWSDFELAIADKEAHELWMGIHGIKSLDGLLQRAEAAEERASALDSGLASWREETQRYQKLWNDERERASALAAESDRFRHALAIIADVGDGYGPRNQMSGTTGEGHAECRNTADDALGIKFEDLPRDPNEAFGNRTVLNKFGRARAALSSTTPKCPEDSYAPQATHSHESGDKG